MLCAHTVRKLKPGTYEAFKEKFALSEDDRPEGWVRFHMLRSLSDENEVVTFGFFDGTIEELEASQADGDYDERRGGVDDLVEEVVANGVYAIDVSLTVDGAPS